MGYGFVKTAAAKINFNAVTSVQITFTGGNTNGDTIVVCVDHSTGQTVTGATDTEGNTYTKVAAFPDMSTSLPQTQSWLIAPVTGGSGANNVVTVNFSAAAAGEVYGLEYSGLALVGAFLGFANSPVGISGPSCNYNFSLSVPAMIVTMNSRRSGGVTWSGLSGTDRGGTGPPNQQLETNDFLGAIGNNAITATSSSNSFGSGSIALAIAGGNQRTLVGVGT